MNGEFLTWQADQDQIILKAKGEWTLHYVPQIEAELQHLPSAKKLLWDLSEVKDFDSSGVLLFIEYLKRFQKQMQVEVVNYTPSQKEMYDLLREHMVADIPERKQSFLDEVGEATVETLHDIKDFITFLGHLFATFFYAFTHPRTIRFKETVYHIHQSGFNALVIIAMTSFLVGMVIAYQGAVELAKFGADIFIVDTVGISIVRELGPMITAIVIAGRSGSAYTAEIGAMKITEEIAAMRTMGFDPYNFLVLPRIFALMIALPLLIFFSDIIGILGGMVASEMVTGISYDQFISRLYEVLEVKHYILGMIKGPVFAFVIAAIGCFRGFQVSDNTESIGLHTTASVVNSIFMVIAFDALFSVIYTDLGL
jgi:phospholipid/cholesterol/gamma-HCH transport system permease protein